MKNGLLMMGAGILFLLVGHNMTTVDRARHQIAQVEGLLQEEHMKGVAASNQVAAVSARVDSMEGALRQHLAQLALQQLMAAPIHKLNKDQLMILSKTPRYQEALDELKRRNEEGKVTETPKKKSWWGGDK